MNLGATPTNTASTLDVLTLNVWGLPWPLSRRRRQRFRAIADRIGPGSHDLVGLQEVWGGAHRLLGHLRPHKADGSDASGLALAGRMSPAERPRLRAFRTARSTDAFVRKGVLHAWVEAPGVGPVAVLVTHLQAGGHAAVRAHQVDEVLDVASRLSAPTVLMGDFNFQAEDRCDVDSDARLAAAGFVDAAGAVGCHAPTWHPSDAWMPRGGAGERFDRIYVRSGRGVRLEPTDAAVVEGAGMSDHRPLWARLRVATG